MSAKKPAARRQGRGTNDVGTVVRPMPSRVPAPPHPQGRKLLASTVKAWERFWASDLSSLVKPEHTPALERLFRMYDMRERLERVALKQPVVSGSTGQPKMSPALGEIASLDGRILALEERFGLNPAAMLKLGISFSQAARSLEDMNRDFDDHDDEEDAVDEDPRVHAIEGKLAQG